MSRHVLASRAEHGWEVVVGWDGPLGTFYAHVLAPDDTVPINRGDRHDRIFQPHLVLDAVRPYAPVPAGLEHALLDDALTDTAQRHHCGTANPWLSVLGTAPEQSGKERQQ